MSSHILCPTNEEIDLKELPNAGMIQTCVLYNSMLNFLAVSDFAGYHRFVVPYLVIEIQQADPEEDANKIIFCEAALKYLRDTNVDVANINTPIDGMVRGFNVLKHDEICAAGLVRGFDGLFFHANMADISYESEMLHAMIDKLAGDETDAPITEFLSAFKTYLIAENIE